MGYTNKNYWNDLVGNEMSLKEVGWPNWTEAYNQARYKLTSYKTMLAFDKFVKQEPIKILEIGCGVGFWTNLITTRYPNAKYTGVDISAKTIEKLRNKFDKVNTQFVLADFSKDISELPKEITDHQYDLIVCFEVLLHIVDDKGWANALSNICKLSSATGTCIISEPFYLYQTPKPYTPEMNCKVRLFEDYKLIIEQNGKSIIDMQSRTFLLDNNFDFKHKISSKLWSFFSAFYHRLLSVQFEVLGKLLGKIAYSFDSLFTSMSKHGNSCRLLVFRK